MQSDALKSITKGHILRYVLIGLVALETLMIMAYYSSEVGGLFNYFQIGRDISYVHAHFTDFVIHRVMNPIFVFDSPKEWLAPVLPVDEMFPNHRILQDNWKIIRDEALTVSRDPTLIKPASQAAPAAFKSLARYATRYQNVSSTKDYWKTSILRFYGKDFPEVLKACPQTTKLLNQMPEIELAMFSVMEGGATIPVHRGPLRGAVRYHLPLVVPGYTLDGEPMPEYHDQSALDAKYSNTIENQCVIVVGEDIDAHFGKIRGGKMTNMITGSDYSKSFPTYKHVWKPGEGILFDDTYAHSVANHHPSNTQRIVLFLDVKRPHPWFKGHIFHFGTFLFTMLKWTGIPITLFFRNAMNEKPVYKTLPKFEDTKSRRLREEKLKRIELSYNHFVF